MSSTADQSTEVSEAYLALRHLLFSDRTLDQLLAEPGPDEPILERAVAEMRAGRPAEACSELETAGALKGLRENTIHWIVLAKARCLDGNLEGARDAVRQMLRIEGLETRWELQAWALLRELGGQPDKGNADEVLGVVVEMGMEGAVATVAGFADGDARIFWSSGGGILGDLKVFPQVSAAAKRLVASAQKLARHLSPDASQALPAAGRVCFALLTRAGIRTAEEVEPQLRRRHHRFYPVYAAAHGLIAGLRTVYEGQGR